MYPTTIAFIKKAYSKENEISISEIDAYGWIQEVVGVGQQSK
jgi:hypothetical protein